MFVNPQPGFSQTSQLFRDVLLEHLNQQLPLLQLTKMIDWEALTRIVGRHAPVGTAGLRTAPLDL